MKNMKQDVFNTIFNIIHDTIGEDKPKDANLNSSVSKVYYSMNMDSLDEIEIVMKLEQHYGISIPDEEVTKYKDKTFDDFCGFVCSLITAQQQPVSLYHKIKQIFQHIK